MAATTTLRIGQGYDVHALEDGKTLRLCGVDVPSDKRSVAHSDGDVAVHALCDALLGAAAAGDIGLHFPDTDAAYRGIDSMVLLARVVAIVAERGFDIVNVDVTISLQAPKLRPRIDEMRGRLSEALCIAADCVSVKATTTEHLGFEGRREGISATAVALLEKRA